MYIYQSRKNGKFYGLIDLVWNYPNYLDIPELEEIFENIRDCSGYQFDLYCDSHDATIDEKIIWMIKHKYIKPVEVEIAL